MAQNKGTRKIALATSEEESVRISNRLKEGSALENTTNIKGVLLGLG